MVDPGRADIRPLHDRTLGRGPRAPDELTEEQARLGRDVPQPSLRALRRPRPIVATSRKRESRYSLFSNLEDLPTFRSAPASSERPRCFASQRTDPREALVAGRRRSPACRPSGSPTRPSSRGSSERSRRRLPSTIARRPRSCSERSPLLQRGGGRPSSRPTVQRFRGASRRRAGRAGDGGGPVPRARNSLLARRHAPRARRAHRRLRTRSTRHARSSRGSRRSPWLERVDGVHQRHAPRCPRDLPDLRDREPRGAEVLLRMRHGARARVPDVRRCERARREVLRRVRDGAHRRRAAVAPDRPRRRHALPSGASSRSSSPTSSGFTTFSEAHDAEDVRELLSRYFEHRAHGDRALRRHGREVHRRRRHGRLGRSGRAGGRRRAGRPRRARPGRRRRGARRRGRSAWSSAHAPASSPARPR